MSAQSNKECPEIPTPSAPLQALEQLPLSPMESPGHPHSGLHREGFGVSLPCILLIAYSQVIEITFPFLLCLWPAMLRTMLLLLFFLHLTGSTLV